MSKKRNYLFIVMAIILAGLLILLLYRTISGNLTDSRMKPDPASEAWEPDDTSDSTSQIKIPGYETIVFHADETQQEITLYNPAENSCFFCFTLFIGEEETPIYESALVEPGNAIRKITLNRPLSAGDYQLNIHIDTYDITTNQPLNSAISSAELSVR